MACATVEQILITEGPCLTSRVCEILEKSGLSSAAARQRVSRARGKVKRLEGLVFPHKVRFIYHETHFNSDNYWKSLLDCLSKAGSAYAPAILSLSNRGGISPLRHFDIISGSPVLQKGQISSQTALDRLKHVRILKQIDLDGIGQCVCLGDKVSNGYPKLNWLQARLLTEKILLLAVKDWARKLGIASYEKIQLRDDLVKNPRVGTFSWDLAGPCYLSPLVRYDKSKKIQPGFLVCDVVVTGEILNRGAVEAFVRKVHMLKHLKNIPPVLPIMISDQFSADAFRYGRSCGIIMGTPGSVFGRDVARGIDVLLKVLANAAAIVSQHPEVIPEIFGKLATIEGAAGNLRGPLFEMIVAHCVKKNDEGSVDIGKKVSNPDNGKQAEIDVLRTRDSREAWIYECKGYHAGNRVKLNEVQDWIDNKVPIIRNFMKNHSTYMSYKLRFEFWTTSSFDDDALEFLKTSSMKVKKYEIGWKDGQAVRQYASQIPLKSMLEVLDQHYFNHPLTKLDKKYDGNSAMGKLSEELGFDSDIITTEYEIEDYEVDDLEA